MIFALEPDDGVGAALAAAVGEPVAPHEDRRFVDGEHKVRPLVDPHGAHVHVVQSLHGGPVDSGHDRLCRLLMFVGTLRDHGAASVTAVVPYLAYARKDRRTKPYDPLSLRYLAQLLEAVGTSRIVALEVHNLPAFENAFRIPALNVEARDAFDEVAVSLAGDGPLAVASPDPGGIKRAQLWHESLEARLGRPVGFAFVDKRRSAGQMGGPSLVAGDVRDATVFVLDDLIASGGTLRRAAVALRAVGAARVVACAAHGLFIPPAAQELGTSEIDQVVVTDSVPAFRLPEDAAVRAKLRVVSAVPLLARAIRPG